MSERNFFAELKRRNVYKVAVAYAVVSWLLIQIATQVFPFFDIPNWAVRVVVLLLALGFPVALVLAWAFEITPEGIRRESEIEPDEPITYHTGRKLIGITIAVAVAAGGMLAFQLLRPRLMTEQIPAASPAAPAAVISEQSIAVLPFADKSEAQDQGYFSDGISEELLNLLGRIPQLRVPSRTSSFSSRASRSKFRRSRGCCDVANVLEGSVSKNGDQLRITTQLIRAADGFHLWSETYDRKMDDIFKIQDEIAGEVVKELKVKLLGGGAQGAHDRSAGLRPLLAGGTARAAEVTARRVYDSPTRSTARPWRSIRATRRRGPGWRANFNNKLSSGLIPSREGNARAREAAEKALAIDPDYAHAHAVLGWIAMFR